MYITRSQQKECNENDDFNWEFYFSRVKADEIIKQMNASQIVSNLRKHLTEDKFRLTLSICKMMRSLFEGIDVDNPRVLELGAATGFLTRWLISQYGGSGVLVDRSEGAYKAFLSMDDDFRKAVTYVKGDIFEIELERTFDLVCSFGLIEHFKKKKRVIDIHKKFVNPNGYILIIIPLDTLLTRLFFEVYVELNFGYRELLNKKEFEEVLTGEDLEISKIAVSEGYSYDFAGAVCKKK
jgi:SAM-dependent methyltransferase